MALELHSLEHNIKRDEEFEREVLEHAEPFKPTKTDTLNINASTIGGCHREAWFARNGYEDERGSRVVHEQKFVYFMGNAIERAFFQLLGHIRKMGGKPRIRDADTGVSGEFDAVIMDVIDGKEVPTVVEVKSSHDGRYRKVYDELLMNGIMPDNHYNQIQVYLMMEPQFPYCRYVIFNMNMNLKNSMPNFLVFKVFRDDKKIEELKQWIKDHNEFMKSTTPPHSGDCVPSWKCNAMYCGYKNACKSIDWH